MKKYLLVIGLTVVLGGCIGDKQSVSSGASGAGGSEAKQGDTTLEGMLTVTGDKGFLKTSNGVVSLESYTVKLSEYAGKKVKVKGQYSGDTLFVDEIK